MELSELINGITSGALDVSFRELYGSSGTSYLKRRAEYISAAERFSWLCPTCGELKVFTVPGEAMIAGEKGSACTLSAAVGNEMTVFAARCECEALTVAFEGGETVEIPTDPLETAENEHGTVSELVKRLAGNFKLGGGVFCYVFPSLKAVNTASAALLLAAVMNAFYNDGEFAADELARIAAEAVDASTESLAVKAHGGFVLHDGGICSIPYNMEACGYTLCIAETGESCIGGFPEKLRTLTDEDELIGSLGELGKEYTSAELAYSLYLLGEERRVGMAAAALSNGDTEGFFDIMNELPEFPMTAGMSLAYTVCRRLLAGSGAVKPCTDGRLIVFVPKYLAADLAERYNAVFGADACRILKLRNIGINEIV